MAIWLRRPRIAEMGPITPNSCARLGFSGDVVPRECFGELMTIESAYAALDADRDAVLAAARQEADRVMAEAVARTEEMIAAAQSEYDAAAERGYRDGYDQAFGKWMDRLADVADAQNRLQLRMRERLADIVASAVEQIVRAESRETLFKRALASVERIVDGATYLRVVVHENDLDQARAIFGTLEARWREFGRPIAMSVVADKRLAPGSCVCESDFGAIDASLDTQLRAMRGAVARALKRSIEEAGANECDATGRDESIGIETDRDGERDARNAEQDAGDAGASAGGGHERGRALAHGRIQPPGGCDRAGNSRGVGCRAHGPGPRSDRHADQGVRARRRAGGIVRASNARRQAVATGGSRRFHA